jgi:hypothetical protein
MPNGESNDIVVDDVVDGPPVTRVPTEDDYNATVNQLIHNGWTSDGRDYDWGDGRRPPLYRQSANTEYKPVRKPNGNWELFSKPIRMNANNNINIPTGGRRRYKQKKSKKSKKGSRRRRTRRRK